MITIAGQRELNALRPSDLVRQLSHSTMLNRPESTKPQAETSPKNVLRVVRIARRSTVCQAEVKVEETSAIWILYVVAATASELLQ